MNTSIDYNQLLKSCRTGDRQAREQLFQHLQVRFRAILKYRLRGWPSEDLEDILQETMLVVAEKLPQVESKPDLFALEVLRNKIGNSLIRRRKRINLTLDPTGAHDDQETGNPSNSISSLPNDEDVFVLVENSNAAEAIRKAIGRLSPLCQMLFVALLENLSVAETWEQMRSSQTNLSRSTFDKRIFDCRKRLRQLLTNTL